MQFGRWKLPALMASIFACIILAMSADKNYDFDGEHFSERGVAITFPKGWAVRSSWFYTSQGPAPGVLIVRATNHNPNSKLHSPNDRSMTLIELTDAPALPVAALRDIYGLPSESTTSGRAIRRAAQKGIWRSKSGAIHWASWGNTVTAFVKTRSGKCYGIFADSRPDYRSKHRTTMREVIESFDVD